ncbi:MAG TPA: helix-turn-helix domain-containing protein [Rhizomicrobium sp.]|nr:helix-turn-helix domain-containing protein [Rhizomicrobium sp.]
MPISLSTARNVPGAALDQFAAIHASSYASPDMPVTLNDHLRTLHSYSTRHHYRRGEAIFAEGETADRVYKIIVGTVRLCRFTPSGRRHISDFVLAGDLLGFLECAKHPATAEAVEDVTLISYPRSCIDRLAASKPEIRARLLSHLSDNLLEAQNHLFVLGCQSAKEKVASFLMRLAERTDLGAGETLDLPMGRQDIADHLGMTIETVSRTISMLKNEGTVSVPSQHELVLKNMGALRTLAIEN